MSIKANYKLKNTKYCLILLTLFICGMTSNCYSNENIAFKIVVSKYNYKSGAPISVTAIVQNISIDKIKMLSNLSHEGWLISLTVSGLNGENYYTSPFATVEMTYDALNLFDLKPNHVFGKIFSINTSSSFFSGTPIPAGKYIVQASFSTVKLQSRDLGIPIGKWNSNSIEITISP